MSAKVITFKAWMRLARKDSPTANGPSPGGACVELGLTRQAIHKAIKRGDLDAWRIVDDASGRLRAIIIPQASLERYRALRALQNRPQARTLHAG